jgi:hypothetical protein
MGQQQLLLIVLGVIIVGIAIIVGAIPAFVSGMENANRDAVTHDVLKLASAAQGYFQKDAMLGGGGKTFDDMDISHVGMHADLNGRGENANGSYTVSGNGSVCTITGYSKFERDDGSTNMTVTVTVYPSRLDDPTYSGW